MYICYNNAMFNNNTQCQLVKLLDFNDLLLLFSQAITKERKEKEGKRMNIKKKGKNSVLII